MRKASLLSSGEKEHANGIMLPSKASMSSAHVRMKVVGCRVKESSDHWTDCTCPWITSHVKAVQGVVRPDACPTGQWQ